MKIVFNRQKAASEHLEVAAAVTTVVSNGGSFLHGGDEARPVSSEPKVTIFFGDATTAGNLGTAPGVPIGGCIRGEIEEWQEVVATINEAIAVAIENRETYRRICRERDERRLTDRGEIRGSEDARLKALGVSTKSSRWRTRYLRYGPSGSP